MSQNTLKNKTDSDNKHILVVDDDLDIRTLLGQYLKENSYTVSLASDSKDMEAILAKESIHLIILDVMLPGEDGYAICRKLRQREDTADTPVIMLTAMGEEKFERIVGLEIGADDYMSKPFNPRELLARIKAVLRRSRYGAQNTPSQKDSENKSLKRTLYTFDHWKLDKEQRRLFAPDTLEVSLTSGEFDLLLALIEHPNMVLSRDQLLNLTKNRQANPFDRSIDIQISRLRRRIEKDPKKPLIIKTIRGGGYRFSIPVQKNSL